MGTDVGKRVGQRIRELRLKANLSQAKLAERLGPGVAVETVSRFERGAQVPTFDWVARLAVAMGTDFAGFLSGLATPDPGPPMSGDLRRIVELLEPLPPEHLRLVHRMLRAHVDAVDGGAGRPRQPAKP